MTVFLRAWLTLGVVILTAATLSAQQFLDDPPTVVKPRTPQTGAELDRREALKLYAQGLSLERDSLLLEAAKVYERALKLDPESNVLRKALAPLYLALDRTEDALEVCREVVDRDPGDYETWYLLARQYRLLDKAREAAQALHRAGACAELEDQPALRLQVAFDLGVVQESLQDFAAAEAAFADVVAQLEAPDALVELEGLTREEIASQTAEACEKLGRVAVRAGHPDKAIAAYRKAQEKDPRRQFRLAYNLADVYFAQGQHEKALASLDSYLRSQPQGTEAYELKINLLRKLGRDSEVIASLSADAQADAENVELKLLLARECGKAGRAPRAEGIYKALLEKTARADVYRGLFTLYKAQGGNGGTAILNLLNAALKNAAEGPPRTPVPEQARGNTPQAPNAGDLAVEAARARAMLLVLRDEPEMVKLLLPAARQALPLRWGQDGLHHDTRRFLAVLAARTRQLDDAEQFYRSCLQEHTGLGRRGEAELYSGLLQVLWQSHKYEAIVKVCEEGLANAQATNRVLFHRSMAQALGLLGRTAEAIAQANQAVDLSDDNRLSSRSVRIAVLGQAGKFQEAEAEALELFKEAKSEDDQIHCRYTLSSIYSLAKNYPKAEEQLEKIIAEHADEAQAHNDLGYTWADQGKKLDEAEKLIRRALELDRKNKTSGPRVDADADHDNGAYIDSLGWVLFRRGKLEEARTELEKAIALPDAEDDPVVWDHLGDVYARLNEVAKARAAWNKAVEFSTAGRRKMDDRVRDIRGKLKLLEQAGPRR